MRNGDALRFNIFAPRSPPRTRTRHGPRHTSLASLWVDLGLGAGISLEHSLLAGPDGGTGRRVSCLRSSVMWRPATDRFTGYTWIMG